MRRMLPFLLLLLCGSLSTSAQSNKAREAYEAFKKQAFQEYENFRKKCMNEYLEFVQLPWEDNEEEAPLPKPKEEPVPPVIMPEEEKNKSLEDNPIVVEEVIPPIVVEPQPKPIEPIPEVPVDVNRYLEFSFFGTPAKVRFDEKNKVTLRGYDGDNVANTLREMATEAYDNLIIDCLNLRKKHALSDWGYLQMLKAMADALYGAGTSESELLVAYVYMQSGYKMRLATDGAHLYMLYASDHYIYDVDSYGVNGDRYYGLNPLPRRLQICPASFPKEQSMSLYINTSPTLSENLSEERRIVSKYYPVANATVRMNKNLIDFYSTYPTSMLGEEVCTRWAMYANTPMDAYIRKTLYPQLQQAIAGKSEREAANVLLDWVQTGLVYEYDETVWGDDRAFFAEESLFYPYCDCEDRSILFTRLVRDLMGLKCILVYYPGHLASAVCFTKDFDADYILLGNKKFVVADPTYIGAPIGVTMPEMDNKSAKVILLE